MRWSKRLLLSLLTLLMLVSTAVYLTPLDAYVPRVEQSLSEQLHEQVSVRHLRLAVLPLPHLELLDVSMGGQNGIAVRSVDVQLDLPGLLVGKLAVRRILVEDGIAHLAQVRKLVGTFADTSAVAQGVTVHELQLSRIRLLTPDVALGPIEGKLEFAQTGQLRRAWFAMNEQKLTVTLLSQPDRRFALVMQARDWVFPQFPQLLLNDLQMVGVLGEQDFVMQKFSAMSRGIRVDGSGKMEFSDGWRVQATLAQMDMPLERLTALTGMQVELTGALSMKGVLNGRANTLSALKDNFQFSGDILVSHATARIAADLQHPMVFDQIKARVVAQPDHLDMGGLEANLYGGKLSGSIGINRKDATLIAEIAVSEIAMQPLVEALTNKVLFTGSMESAAKFSMRLGKFERLPENLKLTGSFHLRNGELSKVDIAQAAVSPGKISDRGGATRFDDLTGLLDVDADGYHFRKIKIASGSLSADGEVDISPSLQLGGTLNADVRGTAGLVSMPMAVSGTLDNPIVSPSKSALAGAAVGTAILGPGLGTAVGIKVGGFLNKLFDKDGVKDNSKDVTRKKASPVPTAKK